MATEESDLESRRGDEGLQGRNQGNPPPILEEVQIGDSLAYRIEKTLEKGSSSGQVCVGQPLGSSAAIGQIGLGAVEVAIKFELRKARGCEDETPLELKAYDDLGNDHGIPLPRVHYKERQGDYNVMVMDLLGQNLRVLMRNNPDNRLAVVACVAVEAISILEKLHSKGYIHGDIKPGNFLLGPPGTPEEKKLYLTDLGLARRWLDNSTCSHVQYSQTPLHFRGTTRYASVHAHLGRASSRRDDLESLAYMLVKLISGSLPWHEYKTEEIKLQKKGRTGLTLSLWIINYNARPSMKQRYYTSVDDLSLPLESEKVCGNGMFVSSVAACSNLWTYIMEDGTGFTSQDCYLSHEFLPEEWIQAKWTQNYRITAIAGADDHRSYVVMSKGTRYIRQLLHVNDTFPFEWIKSEWADGFYVTAMATSGSKWAVVMSNGAGFSDQVVEIDFQYPAEGIFERQKQGYHITSVAASSDQIAFVFSITGEAPASVKQDTLVTSRFPVEGAEELWGRDCYISSMCYCRILY